MQKTSSKKADWFSWFLLLFFCFTMFVTLFAAAEIIFRIRNYQMRKIMYAKNRDLFQIAPFLQIKPRPSVEHHVNPESFRGDAMDLSPDTFRIFTLGGSTTFSGELPYEESYPKKLETKLRDKYPGVKIQVQNAACAWYSTQHSIILYLFKIRHYQPHLLIMKHGINDLSRGFAADCCSLPGSKFESSYLHYFGPIYRLAAISEGPPSLPIRLLTWEKGIRFLKNLSTLPHSATDELQEYVSAYNQDPTSSEIRHFRSLSVFEGNLRLMARIAHLYESQLIFVTESSIYRKDLNERELGTLYFGLYHMTEKRVYPSVASLEYGMRLFKQKVIAVGQEQKVPVVDPEPHIPKTLDYFFDDVHPTEKGLEIEAQMIFEKMVQLKIIDKWIADGKPNPPPSSYRSENPRI